MLKVQNKKVINRLSKKTLEAKRGKNAVIIFAIALTTMMFTALFTIAGAMNESFQEATMRQVGGRSMAGVKCILPEDYEKLSKDAVVKNPSYRIVIGSAINEELAKVGTEVNYAEDENAKGMFCYPTTGKMPTELSEIATSTVVLDALGVPYEIGEKVTLDIWMDDKRITKEFTLSGYWEGDTAAMAQECWVSKAFCEKEVQTPTQSFYDQTDTVRYSGYRMMDFDYSNSWDIEEQTISLLERNGYDTNKMSYGINWAYSTSSVDAETVAIVVVLLCLILGSGYLIIYNIFSLNVVSDIQSYGLLKTIGTTEKQLKWVVRKQAWLLSFVGIPLGLVAGSIVGKYLFPVIVQNIGTDVAMEFTIHPMLMVGAVIFSFFTVWISSNKPCKIAARVSPVAAVGYTEVAFSGNKEAKSTKKVTTFSFAWANLGRNWKKVVIVVMSLSLSMILLNCIYSLVNGFDKDKFVSQYLIGDAQIMDASILNMSAMVNNYNGVTPEIQNDLQELDGVNEIHNIYFSDESRMFFNEKGYKNMMNIVDSNPEYFSGEYEQEEVKIIKEERAMLCDLYAFDQWGCKQLDVYKGSIDWEKFQTGKYVLLNTFYSGHEETGKGMSGMYYDVGDCMEVQLPDGKIKEYEVMAIADVPYALSSRRFTLVGAKVIMPEAEYLKHANEKGALLSVLSLDKEKEKSVNQRMEQYTETQQKNLTYVCKQTYEEEFGDFVQMFWIVGGALSFVLALIGIMNFTNAIVTGILARKKELAMMEAVGMTGKQMKGMLAWEGMFYIVLTGICSICIGSLFSAVILKNLATEMWFLSYHFTVLPILICIPVLAFIAGAIPVIAYGNMEKEAVVERMRGKE